MTPTSSNRTPPPRPGLRPGPRPEALAGLVESLSESPTEERPSWVRVFGPLERPTGIEWDLDPDRLLGYVAPPSCAAVGIVGPGWAHGPAGPESRARIRVVVVAERSGGVAATVAFEGGDVLHDAPDGGRLLDVLRRCLGLATPPPAVPPEQLVAVLWLDALAAHDASTPLTWGEVAGHRPLGRETVAMAGDWAASWERLRFAAQHGGPTAELVPPGTAGWMDSGMFSRWVLDHWPSLDELFVLVEPRLTPAARRALRGDLSRMGVAIPTS